MVHAGDELAVWKRPPEQWIRIHAKAEVYVEAEWVETQGYGSEKIVPTLVPPQMIDVAIRDLPRLQREVKATAAARRPKI
jgi:hypothetical protein